MNFEEEYFPSYLDFLFYIWFKYQRALFVYYVYHIHFHDIWVHYYSNFQTGAYCCLWFTGIPRSIVTFENYCLCGIQSFTISRICLGNVINVVRMAKVFIPFRTFYFVSKYTFNKAKVLINRNRSTLRFNLSLKIL